MDFLFFCFNKQILKKKKGKKLPKRDFVSWIIGQVTQASFWALRFKVAQFDEALVQTLSRELSGQICSERYRWCSEKYMEAVHTYIHIYTIEIKPYIC